MANNNIRIVISVLEVTLIFLIKFQYINMIKLKNIEYKYKMDQIYFFSTGFHEPELNRKKVRYCSDTNRF